MLVPRVDGTRIYDRQEAEMVRMQAVHKHLIFSARQTNYTNRISVVKTIYSACKYRSGLRASFDRMNLSYRCELDYVELAISYLEQVHICNITK